MTKYIRKLDQISQLSKDELKSLQPVVHKFAFRINDYYLSLIDWSDPEDPIRRIAFPDLKELQEE